MRQLGYRLPPPADGSRYSEEAAALLVGKHATLTIDVAGTLLSAKGHVVSARVVDDDMLGHGLFVVVQEP